MDPGSAVPDAGSDPFVISCPSTHPLVTSLHGRTVRVHLGGGTALQGEDLASLKQGAGLKKRVWIAYPFIKWYSPLAPTPGFWLVARVSCQLVLFPFRRPP